MNNEFTSHVKGNAFLYVLSFVALVVGIAAGSFCSVKLGVDEEKELSSYIADFFSYYKDNDIEFAAIFKSGLLYNLKYVLLCTIVSLSIYTFFAVYLMLGLRGFSLGFTVGLILIERGANGMLFLILTVLPSCVLTLPLYLYMCVMCTRCAISRHRLRENYRERKRELKSFLIIMLFLFVALVVCGMIDTFLSPLVVKYVI